ncbi:type VII secretion target [Actinomycetospora sp.]|uniref:type VII secretion target n=1 Tax=Actinomycetospora sp. TaxID=1872135 RepID=UPI002F426289
MPDGFDVHPEQLRRGAVGLRADADSLDDAAVQAGAAVDQVSQAAGPGPLAGAASELATKLDRAVQAIRTSLADCAGALEASSAQYLTSDARASSGLDGPH